MKPGGARNTGSGAPAPNWTTVAVPGSSRVTVALPRASEMSRMPRLCTTVVEPSDSTLP